MQLAFDRAELARVPRACGDDPHVPDSRLSSKLPFPWCKTSSFPTSRRGNLAMRNEPHNVHFGVKTRESHGGLYEAIRRIVGFTASFGGIFRGNPRLEVLPRRSGRRHGGSGNGEVGAAKSPKPEREGLRRAKGKSPFGGQRKAEG